MRGPSYTRSIGRLWADAGKVGHRRRVGRSRGREAGRSETVTGSAIRRRAGAVRKIGATGPASRKKQIPDHAARGVIWTE
jgi:hypothetical protein